MSRIAKIPREKWTLELNALFSDQDASELQLGLTRILAHKPAAAEAVLGLNLTLARTRELTDRLVELVRLRIAFHNQCRSCMAVRYRDAQGDSVEESLVCSLERPMEAPNLTDAERAALGYADLFAKDHLAINDSTYDNLKEHFTEAQIVELGIWCAFCVGIGRLGATWDMVEELPKDYQDHSVNIAPWQVKPAELHG